MEIEHQVHFQVLLQRHAAVLAKNAGKVRYPDIILFRNIPGFQVPDLVGRPSFDIRFGRDVQGMFFRGSSSVVS